MKGLYIVRGPLCRPFLALPSRAFNRHKFSGRTRTVDKPNPSSLPITPARTRFAPSPTGYVHIGSLRTALYNFLLAKATGGQFLLRIEDTDRLRIVSDAEKRLYEDLKWAGLSWDEGPDVGGRYGPYRQSDRLELYTKYADQLIGEGRAYRCFCTPEDLDHMRSISIQEGGPTTYNRTCSHIPPDVSARRAANGEQHCVRFKCDHRPLVNDLVYGRYTKPEPEDDFIIIKRDGYPTYHFANVVDDHLMEITHVIRGAEWLVSTPRHIALYEAFGWQTPQFAHVGLLVNQEKQKLSKRHGDVDIASWRDRGILPITLLNYVMLLGWSLGKGVKGQQEVMDLDEMISKFNLGFTKGDITVNTKHEFLQKAHVKRLVQSTGPQSVSNLVIPAVEARVRKYEEQRMAHSPSRAEGTPTSDPITDPAAEFGPVTSPARSQPSENGEAVVSTEYLRKLLEADIQNYRDAETFVLRNRYLIWEVPDAVYHYSITHEATTPEIFTILQEPVLPGEEEASPERTRCSVSKLTATLRDLLQSIPDAEWTADNIDRVVKPFLKSVVRVSTKRTDEGDGYREESVDEPWGYHLLRWVVTALRPGPALIPSLALLGREESLRRVEKAYEIAKKARR
ncbi:hypothetical protein GGS26DRAFT_271171 [Hypomontagnella submonticulosa]|nr:hypothetical protein GGS26DRAFT_271171 [Hypomontagnella submonticulosa]